MAIDRRVVSIIHGRAGHPRRAGRLAYPAGPPHDFGIETIRESPKRKYARPFSFSARRDLLIQSHS
jgi:hypothetical protein